MDILYNQRWVVIKRLLALGFAIVVGTGGLALDLVYDGLVDQLLWNVTGETDPFEQLLGGVQYLANTTRRTPQLGPTHTIDHKPANPFGINAFLELEAEPSKRQRSMQMIAEAGFGWVRQQFAWEDIEIEAKGVFWDTRTALPIDTYEHGTLDLHEYSSWEKYDQIVRLANAYHINLLARISGPTPRWALAPDTTNTHSPPLDTQDFVDYAVVVATRYQGRITNYQIWNEPNLYPEWGDQLIDPVAYADLLCRTHDALKAIDPKIVIHTGAIGPTIDLSGHNAYDLLYLQKLYDAGAGRCFDVLSAQGYGLFTGPTDRRLRPYTVNFGRHQWLRDVMVANGDSRKPIWISEAGWNPVPNDPTIIGLDTYGRVTMQQAAEWVPLAYERALTEWPYIGVINYWFFKRPHDLERGQSYYYFRLVEPSWEPTPIYNSFKAYIQSGDWQNLESENAWESRARRLLPNVLVGGVAVLLIGYAFGVAILKRLRWW